MDCPMIASLREMIPTELYPRNHGIVLIQLMPGGRGAMVRGSSPWRSTGRNEGHTAGAIAVTVGTGPGARD